VLTPQVASSCGTGCCSHTIDDQRTAHSGLPKEVVCTNMGAQVDIENAPRVLHLAVSMVTFYVTGFRSTDEVNCETQSET
jgi:hypothetical protein